MEIPGCEKQSAKNRQNIIHSPQRIVGGKKRPEAVFRFETSAPARCLQEILPVFLGYGWITSSSTEPSAAAGGEMFSMADKVGATSIGCTSRSI